jgi:hypothetical protein
VLLGIRAFRYRRFSVEALLGIGAFGYTRLWVVTPKWLRSLHEQPARREFFTIQKRCDGGPFHLKRPLYTIFFNTVLGTDRS